ncbi:tRNA (adenosine(37)-N6)-threonylcarbamoyltransferase complex dimerization subunit type 1 TsaB [Anaeromassilibacillus senegalensis]|uniref:tRNA (Adenosine(37)-N6)-threonylcarbamoyltransferase complex dimerization subunit type 1 TsaB n=1 Tax=Anaeromassilibacillus senegalensis TaxID=1673717 RepID=A0ABS9CM50_9FIRM|nr:tRNA (adenosine(37)-N6)-threonylcarbamoyltransferase complex dimerization subunit type 1 TsaB [Anaeromassilibacillus senegalensis]MCF2652038.1 tRNA (adenosine(37)-N6)-threonylcarbamoyltransferase complex dimerization subunit type 1 TsaB [Anaeromassilibacillus senegalensis]MCI5650741.1 tRNA (adenosine(37)-N6)-threonylcarbamoyltransferase complex dimerization subunit type 1 TsaB [Ruminococcus bromii]
MLILALDSSASPASAALLEDGKILSEFYINTKQTHSQTLMPMAEAVLRLSAKTLDDVDCLAVSAGPGSFTGVRIGVSCVKGLAMARNIPCAGVSTLRAMAENARGMDGIVCAVMDARCGQVYNALFRVENGEIERLCADRALPISELYAECKAYGDKLLLVGDGAALCHKTFSAFGARLLQPQQQFQRASGVAIAAQEQLCAGQTVTPDALMPIYLRLPQAERELKKKQESGGR